MKHYYLLSLLVACAFCFMACPEQANDPSNSNVKEKTEGLSFEQLEASSTPVDTIHYDKFIRWKGNWDANFRNYMANDSLHYFEFPIIDMQELVNSGATDTRLYLGMEIKSNGDKALHLMSIGLKNNVMNTALILDYTRACPPICPPPK